MKLIFKISCILTFCSLLIFTVITMNMNAYADNPKWSKAYLEAMEDYSKKDTKYCDCMLVYLDDDNIPEFYIGDPLNEWYGGLYSYSKDKLVKLRDFGFRDFFSEYSKNKGIFRNDYYINRNGSKTGTKFLKLEKNSLTVIDELTHDVINNVYEVNGKTVTKDAYDKKIAEYTLTKPESDEILTYDKMKEHLLNLKEDNNTTDVQATSETSQISSDPTATQTTTTSISTTDISSTTNSNTTSETTITTTTSETETTTSVSSTTSATTSNTTTSNRRTITSSTTTTRTNSPKTGDSEPIGIEWALIALSTTGIITLLLIKLKNKKYR